MRKINGFIVSIIVGMLALTGYGQTSQTPQSVASEEVLSRKVGGDSLENLLTTDAVSRSLSSARVPGGIVEVASCVQEEREHTVIQPNSSLREALNSIVQANPKYQWRFDEGVVNLELVKDNPELLNFRIAEFHVENAKTVNGLLHKLLEMPEVKERIAELHLSEPSLGLLLGGDSPPRKQGFNIHCKNATVREVLNAIVRAHGRAVWLYWEWHCDGRKVYKFDFIVR